MSDSPQNPVFRLASRPNGGIAPWDFELVDAPMSGPADSRKCQLTHRPERHGDYRPHGAKVKVIARIEDPAVIAHMLKHLKQKEALKADMQPHERRPEPAPPAMRRFD